MIKALACIILSACVVGTFAGMVLDTFLGDLTWLFVALALFGIDAAWKWLKARAARERAQR